MEVKGRISRPRPVLRVPGWSAVGQQSTTASYSVPTSLDTPVVGAVGKAHGDVALRSPDWLNGQFKDNSPTFFINCKSLASPTAANDNCFFKNVVTKDVNSPKSPFSFFDLHTDQRPHQEQLETVDDIYDNDVPSADICAPMEGADLFDLSPTVDLDGLAGFEDGEFDLDNLSVTEIKELLLLTHPHPSDVVELKAAVEHDHNYLTEDWKILSEFIDLTQQSFDQLASQDDGEGRVGTEMRFGGTMHLDSAWLENAVDVTPFLAGEDVEAVHSPVETATAAPGCLEMEEETTCVVDQDVQPVGKGHVSVPQTYRERRNKNNIASQRSRQLKKQRLAEMKSEVVKLEIDNDSLKAHVARLQLLTAKWKQRLLSTLGEPAAKKLRRV